MLAGLAVVWRHGKISTGGGSVWGMRMVKQRAAARAVRGGNPSAMSFHKSFDDGEPQSAAAGGRIRRAEKFIENARQ